MNAALTAKVEGRVSLSAPDAQSAASEDGIVIKPGKGFIVGKFISEVDGDGVPGGPFEAEVSARAAAEAWRAKKADRATESASERARRDVMGERIKAGTEPTANEIKSLDLASPESDIRWFFPTAANLFGLTSRQVRPMVATMIRVASNDMGTKRELVPTKNALMAIGRALAGVKDMQSSTKEETETRSATQESTTPAKIEDFGEKLAGARKDYASIMKDAEAVDISAEPLSKSWPEPDYQKLLDGGADPFVVAWVHAGRDEIPTKPQSSWKLSNWAAQVTMLRDISFKLVSGEISKDKLLENLGRDEFKRVRDHVGIIAKLQDQSASNDYLANIVSQQAWDVSDAMRLGDFSDKGPASSYPYPTVDEMPAIRAAFDDFFKTVETRDGGDGKVAMFATGGAATGSTIADVEQTLGQLTDGMKNAPLGQVVQSASDLPFDAPADAKGAYWRGTIYLVADNIGSAQDARDVIAHEMIGHYGLRGFFGRELADVLDQIHASNPLVRIAAGQWVRDNQALISEWQTKYGMTDEQVKSRSIEEAMVGLAEKGRVLKGLNRLAAILQTLLRKMGATKWADALEAAALMLGMLMLMAGAGGLPFEDDLEDVTDMMAQWLGYNFSTKKAKQEFLEGLFGPAWAQFIDKGISGMPGSPIDTSGRMTMGNLIPGTGFLLTKRDHTSDAQELLGPAGDLIKRAFNGGKAILTGDFYEGAKTLAPKALYNFEKGADMAVTGNYNDDRGYKVIEATPFEAAMKAIGFQPASVAEVQQSNYLNQRAKDFYSLSTQAINARWAKGIYEKDQAQVEDARAMVQRWNENNPDQRMKPNMPVILKRVRDMRKSKDERIADTAPKAMRAQMQREVMQAREAA